MSLRETIMPLLALSIVRPREEPKGADAVSDGGESKDGSRCKGPPLVTTPLCDSVPQGPPGLESGGAEGA